MMPFVSHNEVEKHHLLNTDIINTNIPDILLDQICFCKLDLITHFNQQSRSLGPNSFSVLLDVKNNIQNQSRGLLD